MLFCKVVTVFACLKIVSTYSTGHIAALWNDIIKDRNKEIRPAEKPSDPVVIYFYFHLTNILELNEVQGKLSIRGYFGAHWHDSTVKWDPKVYGVESLTYNEELLWKPTFVLSNPFGQAPKLHKDDSVKRIHYHGRVDWLPSGTFDVTCEFDVSAYPFDSQNCFIGVVVEGYAESEVFLVPIGFYTDWLAPHRTWELIEKNITRIGVPQVVYFHMTLERKPMFFVFNLILPIVLMCIMNPFVFLLPAESGERVGYSVTVLLAIAVFLTISSSSLPAVSEPIIPSICILLFVDVAFSAVIVLMVIFTLRFYLRDENIPVSKICAMFVKLMRLIRCGCSRKVNSNEQEKDETVWTTDEYQYRGIKRSDLASIEPNETAAVTWKDAGQELDIVFGLFSGIIIVVVHLIYILVVLGVIKWK